MSEEESVWVVPVTKLDPIKAPLGAQFTADRGLLLNFWEILKDATFREREAMETDHSFKQIIPYLVVSSGSKFLTYRRAGSEERLVDKLSIGLGGHINPEDQKNPQEPPLVTVLRGVAREIDEELYLEAEKGERISCENHFSGKLLAKALIHDCSNAVGYVHYGVVFRADLPWDVAQHLRLSSENKDLEWRDLEDLKGDDKLESWSKIVVDALTNEDILFR